MLSKSSNRIGLIQKKPLKRFMFKSIFLTILILLSLIYCKFDFNKLTTYFTLSATPAIFFSVILMFIVNFLLVSFRLQLTYRQFGYRLCYKTAAQTVLVGQFGAFLPVLGTMLGQGLHLQKVKSISPNVSSIIVLYERILMAVSGVILSVYSVYQVFHDLSWFNMKLPQLNLTVLFLKGLLIFIVVWRFFAGAIRKYFESFRNIHYVCLLMLLAILGWMLSACSIAIVLKLLEVKVSFKELWLTSIVVSFIASLPLSVNGWGLREFAAVAIFDLLGVLKEEAFAASVSVGLYSLIALLMIGSIYMIKCQDKPKEVEITRSLLSQENLDKTIIYFLGMLASALIFFQIHVGFGKVTLNLNLADPLALCSFVIMAIALLTKKLHVSFRIKGTHYFIVGMLLAFLIATFVAVEKIGISNFYFSHKIIGLFILLGYASLGMLMVKKFGVEIFQETNSVISFTLISIILFNLLINFLANMKFLPEEVTTLGLSGCSDNRNAFAIQLLIGLSLLLSSFYKCKYTFWSKKNILASCMLTGILLTYSRSGICLAGIVIGLFAILKVVSFRKIVYMILATLSLVLIIAALEKLPRTILDMISAFELNVSPTTDLSVFDTRVTIIQQNNFEPVSSNYERWYTLFEAIKLWLGSPLFGIGLGNFSYRELLNHNQYLVIHNTFIWLLTEFGLIGILPFFAYGIQSVCTVFKQFRIKAQSAAFQQNLILFALLVIIGGMGMAHEVFYQRILWLIWGMTVVLPEPLSKKESFKYAESNLFEVKSVLNQSL